MTADGLPRDVAIASADGDSRSSGDADPCVTVAAATLPSVGTTEAAG